MANPTNLIERHLTFDHSIEYRDNDKGIELRVLDAANVSLFEKSYSRKSHLQLPELTIKNSPVLKHIFNEILYRPHANLEQSVKARGEFEIFKLYQRDARNGNAEAQFRLGRLYYAYGENESSFFETGLKWLKKAADQGHENATYALCKHEGKRDDRLETAVEAAIQGDVNTQFRLGNFFYDDKQYQLAFFWFSKAVDQGHTKAKYYLGRCYLNGEGVEQNIEEGWHHWIQESGEEGNIDAQYHLGRLYFDNINKDLAYSKLAVEWFREAAGHGHPEAKYYLGVCYLNAIGVEEDEKLAIQCLQEASKKNVVDAELLLSEVYVKRGEQEKALPYIQQAELELMADWVQYAVETQKPLYSPALYITAVQHRDGLQGMTEDPQEAQRWFQKASERGYRELSLRLNPRNTQYSIHPRVERWRTTDLQEILAFEDRNLTNLSEADLAKERIYHNLFGVEKIISDSHLRKIYTFPIDFPESGYGMLVNLLLIDGSNKLGFLNLGIDENKVVFHSYFKEVEYPHNGKIDKLQKEIDRYRWGWKKLEDNNDDVNFITNPFGILEVEYKNENYKALIYPISKVKISC